MVRSNFSKSATPKHLSTSSGASNGYKPKINFKIKIILPLIILLALIAGGTYWLIKNHQHKTSTKNKSTTQQVATSPVVASSTKHYVSNEQSLSVEFDYPSNWQVNPISTTATGSSPITITSPITTISDSSGSSNAGKVIISIQASSDQITGLSSGNATSAQVSTQIGYTHPAADQHQYPYLSFVNLSSGSNSNGAFGQVIITGVTQFNKGDSITPPILADVSPVISASFYHCSSNNCSGQSASILTITSSEWQNESVFQQVLALFQSLILH
jgi:hypothetical protein